MYEEQIDALMSAIPPDRLDQLILEMERNDRVELLRERMNEDPDLAMRITKELGMEIELARIDFIKSFDLLFYCGDYFVFKTEDRLCADHAAKRFIGSCKRITVFGDPSFDWMGHVVVGGAEVVTATIGCGDEVKARLHSLGYNVWESDLAFIAIDDKHCLVQRAKENGTEFVATMNCKADSLARKLAWAIDGVDRPSVRRSNFGAMLSSIRSRFR